MNKSEKQVYNQRYYQKKKQVLLERAKTSKSQALPEKHPGQGPSKVIALFAHRASKRSGDEGLAPGRLSGRVPGKVQDPPKKISPQPRRRALLPGLSLKVFFLALLVAGNSYFLLSETAQFYQVGESPSAGLLPLGALKAALMEAAVLALALLIRAQTRGSKLWHALLMLAIYSYSVWVASGSLIERTLAQSAEVGFQTQQVEALQQEITAKEVLRERSLEGQRLTAALKIEVRLEVLRGQQLALQTLLAQRPDPSALWNQLVSGVLFRLLVMFSQLLCLKELKRLLNLKPLRARSR